MVKRSPVEVLYAGSVHPGKYLVLVGGEVAHVEEALPAGREAGREALIDEIFLGDVDARVVAALRGRGQRGEGEALGIIETHTVAAILGAADAGVKGADVTLEELRIADDLGGKGTCLFAGSLADVEAGVEAAVAGLTRQEALISHVVIPQLHPEMAENLRAGAEFIPRLRPLTAETGT